MAVRRIMNSAPAKKAARKAVSKGHAAKAAPKKAAANKVVPPSSASIMLNELRPSIDALHDRVKKLRLRFA